MKKTGLNGDVYEFNADYNFGVDRGKAIPFVHKYLMTKYNIK